MTVGEIGAVPFHASSAEASAQVGRHSHEPAVRAVGGHIREFGLLRKINHGSVRHSGWSCHAEVSLAKKDEGFFHDVHAARHICDACFNHLGFVEIAEIDFLIGHGVYLSTG